VELALFPLLELSGVVLMAAAQLRAAQLRAAQLRAAQLRAAQLRAGSLAEQWPSVRSRSGGLSRELFLKPADSDSSLLAPASVAQVTLRRKFYGHISRCSIDGRALREQRRSL
jgi:uncharacterized protein YjbI with pentapeptide repeats